MSPLLTRPPLLPAGQSAPDFRLLDTRGYSVGLSALTGRQGCVLLFFSGMSGSDDAFLKGYADAYPDFSAAGIEVLALSSRNWESLRQCAEHLQLPYPILFDPCVRVSKRYGALSIPRFLTGRAVFVLGPDGIIRVSGKALNPAEVLAAFKTPS